MNNTDYLKQFEEKFKYQGEGLWAEMIDSYDEDDNYKGKVRAWAIPNSFKQFLSETIEQVKKETLERMKDKCWCNDEITY